MYEILINYIAVILKVLRGQKMQHLRRRDHG